MAHFYGTLNGNRGEATRLGTKASGIEATVETWGTVCKSSIDHIDHVVTEAHDRLTVQLSTKNGWGRAVISIDDPDLVMGNMHDPEVAKLLDRMLATSERLTEVAGRAQRRKDRERRNTYENAGR